MIRKVFQLGVVVLLGIGAAVAPAATVRAAGARLRAVRLTTSAAGVRVTLDLTRVTSEKVFTLNHPFRAVIDLPQTRVRPGLRVPDARGLVASMRLGARPHGALRLVLVLNAAAGVHVDWGYSRARGAQLVLAIGNAPASGARVVASAAPEGVPTAIHALHAPVDSGRDIIVAVDPGHGGQDPGAIGLRGTQEKNVTLAIARRLAQQLDAQHGMRAILTRDSDIFIPLRERMLIARRAKADLFVSIHADCITDRQIAGASVYILSLRGASSEAARWLAERENDADLKGGVALDDKSSTLASVLLNLS
ncbi:MAG: N-acetylmuramoyl-L-alanine amidase, partial [Steroidobacteraceae bacterium]